MKKSIIITCLCTVFISCDSYLKDTSGDLLTPGKIEEYAPLLYGEAYPRSFNEEAGWFKLMTDDIEMSNLETSNQDLDNTNNFDISAGGEGRYVYLWDYNMGEKVIDKFWEARYANILGCNAVIKALPNMKYNISEVGKYNYLAAQAYALRAYNYFCLINTYALPYSKENFEKPGIIIRTSPNIQVGPIERTKIKDVWDFINSDLNQAIIYMERATPSTNLHLITPSSLLLLASRIALFQEQWDEAIKYGTQFIQENSFIFDLNAIDTTKMGTTSPKDFAIMDASVNKEIVFTFGNSHHDYSYLSTYPALFNLGFRVSRQGEQALLNAYSEDDLRLKAFFTQDYIDEYSETMQYCYHFPIKYRGGSQNYHENWRTVEVYLNLAEAYVQKEKQVSAKVIELLNTLRSRRIKTSKYQALQTSDFQNSNELLKFIWDERRRELCFEELMRFWDLRRIGMPRIEHRWYTDKDNYELYVLQAKSKNYTVQIPASETSVNDLAIPNEREVINPQ